MKGGNMDTPRVIKHVRLDTIGKSMNKSDNNMRLNPYYSLVANSFNGICESFHSWSYYFIIPTSNGISLSLMNNRLNLEFAIELKDTISSNCDFHKENTLNYIYRFMWLSATLNWSKIDDCSSILLEIEQYVDSFILPLLPTSAAESSNMCKLSQIEYTWLVLMFDMLYSNKNRSSLAAGVLTKVATSISANLEFLILGLLQNLNVKNIATKVLSATVCCLCYITHFNVSSATEIHRNVKQILVGNNISQLIRLSLSKAIYPTATSEVVSSHVSASGIEKRSRDTLNNQDIGSLSQLSSDWEVTYSLLGLRQLLQQDYIMSNDNYYKITIRECIDEFIPKWWKRLHDAVTQIHIGSLLSNSTRHTHSYLNVELAPDVEMQYYHKYRSVFHVINTMIESTLMVKHDGCNRFRNQVFASVINCEYLGTKLDISHIRSLNNDDLISKSVPVQFLYYFLIGFSSPPVAISKDCGGIVNSLPIDSLLSVTCARTCHHVLLHIISASMDAHDSKLMMNDFTVMLWYNAVVDKVVQCHYQLLLNNSFAENVSVESMLSEYLPLLHTAWCMQYNRCIHLMSAGGFDVDAANTSDRRVASEGFSIMLKVLGSMLNYYLGMHERFDNCNGIGNKRHLANVIALLVHMISMMRHISLSLTETGNMNFKSSSNVASTCLLYDMFCPWKVYHEAVHQFKPCRESLENMQNLSQIPVYDGTAPDNLENMDIGDCDASYMNHIHMDNANCILTYDDTEERNCKNDDDGVVALMSFQPVVLKSCYTSDEIMQILSNSFDDKNASMRVEQVDMIDISFLIISEYLYKIKSNGECPLLGMKANIALVIHELLDDTIAKATPVISRNNSTTLPKANTNNNLSICNADYSSEPSSPNALSMNMLPVSPPSMLPADSNRESLVIDYALHEIQRIPPSAKKLYSVRYSEVPSSLMSSPIGAPNDITTFSETSKRESLGMNEVSSVNASNPALIEVDSVKIIAQTKEMEFLHLENKELVKSNIQLNGQIWMKESDLKEKDVTIVKLELLLQESYKKLQVLAKMGGKAAEDLAQHKARLVAMEEELLSHRSAITKLNGNNIHDKELCNQLLEKINECNAQLEAKDEVVRGLKKNVSVLNAERDTLKTELAGAKSQFQSLNTNYESIVRKHNDLLIENANHFHVIVANQEKIQLLTDSRDAIQDELEDMKGVLTNTAYKLEEETYEKVEAQSALAALQTEHNELINVQVKQQSEYQILMDKYLKSEAELKKHVEIISLINKISHKKDMSIHDKENMEL